MHCHGRALTTNYLNVRVKQFLQAAKSGEYACRYPLDSETGHQAPFTFTCLQLMAHFREFIRKSGIATNIDSVKGLGWALRKYPGLVEKFECKPVKYVLKVDDDVRNT